MTISVPDAIECPYCCARIPHHQIVAGKFDLCRRCGNFFRRPALPLMLAQDWSEHVLDAPPPPGPPADLQAADTWTAGATWVELEDSHPAEPQGPVIDVVEDFSHRLSIAGIVRNTQPWVLSMLAHMAVVIALGLYVVTAREEPDLPNLLAEWDAAAVEMEKLEEQLLVEVSEAEVAEAASEGNEALEPSELAGHTASQQTAPELDINAPESLPENLSLNPLGRFGANLLGEWEPGKGKGRGRGTGGSGATPRSQFFGVPSYGYRFAFVVDMSGSMSGPRFDRARKELAWSLQQLNAKQSYFVVFYETSPHPMEPVQMLAARPENVSKTIEWFMELQPTGGTMPSKSLLQALALKPNAVFLLSDGQFGSNVVDDAMRAQQQAKTKIPIHTIGFVSRGGETVLKTLSQKTGGIYRFVQ